MTTVVTLSQEAKLNDLSRGCALVLPNARYIQSLTHANLATEKFIIHHNASISLSR